MSWRFRHRDGLIMAAPKATPVIAPANADPVIQRIVTDLNKTIAALRQEIDQMDKRLKVLEA
jgi:hypothetical protein